MGRLFFMFRWLPAFFTYYDRAHLMASVWDGNFFDDKTFNDLPQPGGVVPSLIINGASYSTANKSHLLAAPRDAVQRVAGFQAAQQGAHEPGRRRDRVHAVPYGGFRHPEHGHRVVQALAGRRRVRLRARAPRADRRPEREGPRRLRDDRRRRDLRQQRRRVDRPALRDDPLRAAGSQGPRDHHRRQRLLPRAPRGRALRHLGLRRPDELDRLASRGNVLRDPLQGAPERHVRDRPERPGRLGRRDPRSRTTRPSATRAATS